MKRFLHALGNAFLTVVTILLVVYGWMFVEVKLMLKSYPELFGYVFYLQENTDMSPQFEEQDVILVKKNAEYNTGDIIMYFDSKDSLYKIHNVVSIDNKSVTTICANCDSSNAPVSKDNVVGKAVGKVMFMGAIVAFFSKKFVLVLLALVGVTCLVVSQYVEYKPNRKKVEEKEQEKQLQN